MRVGAAPDSPLERRLEWPAPRMSIEYNESKSWIEEERTVFVDDHTSVPHGIFAGCPEKTLHNGVIGDPQRGRLAMVKAQYARGRLQDGCVGRRRPVRDGCNTVVPVV
jgi:hypothetical protein